LILATHFAKNNIVFAKNPMGNLIADPGVPGAILLQKRKTAEIQSPHYSGLMSTKHLKEFQTMFKYVNGR